MLRLFDPTGGIRYLWRAIRFRNTSWKHYADWSQQFLVESIGMDPNRKVLYIYGSNAGWLLPLRYFSSEFSEIIALDRDPLALLLLRLRVFFMDPFKRNASWKYRRFDFVGALLRGRELPGLEVDVLPGDKNIDDRKTGVKRTDAKVFVLFSNVLGQIFFSDLPVELQDQFFSKLGDKVSNASSVFLSLHERFIFTHNPRLSVNSRLRRHQKVEWNSHRLSFSEWARIYLHQAVLHLESQEELDLSPFFDSLKNRGHQLQSAYTLWCFEAQCTLGIEGLKFFKLAPSNVEIDS